MTADGYRPFEGRGCTIRADVVEAYVFSRPENAEARFLQLRRAQEPMAGDWHPVMGHAEKDESAARCAVRELNEEIRLDARSNDTLGLWALEQTYPFFIHTIDTVVLSPRFAIEVDPGFTPSLNEEHTDARWVDREALEDAFLWPGQRMTLADILREIIDETRASADRLRIDPFSI